MKLKTFLAQRLKGQPWGTPVLYGLGKQYPLLFCARLRDRLIHAGMPVSLLDCADLEWSAIEATLSTTFLGAVKLFWLADVGSLPVATKKRLLEYLKTYKGPHMVFCFVEPDDAPESVHATVLFDESLEKLDLAVIFEFLWNTTPDQFLLMVKQSYKTLSLDMLVLLAQYSIVLGGKHEEFMRSWYEKILLPQESLFTLSQCFFARKKDLFFRSWLAIKDEYLEPFWIVFWSEQLWRAYYVVQLRAADKLAQAKQMSYRLPFSFMQKDWQTFSLAELRNAHDFLYRVDGIIKTGGSGLGIEVFYNKFMNKQF